MPGSPRAQERHPSRSGPTPHRFWILIICAAAVVTHAHVLWGGWVRDDYALILSNPAIRQLSSIPGQLQSPFLGIFWRPSVTISYTLEYALWGLRPAGFHATNLALFTTAAVLVYGVWRSLTRHVLIAGLAGVLYAVHGAHYQPAVIADRTGLLCVTGSLAAWWLMLRASRSTPALGVRITCCAGALAAYAIALGAKEEAVMLPAIVIVGALLSPDRSERPAETRRRVVLGAAAVLPAVAYVIVRGRILGGPGLAATAMPALGQRVFTLPLWLLHHWRDVVIPVWLDIDYRGPVWPYASTLAVLGAWVMVLVCVGLAWRLRERFPELLLGLVIALLIWLPTSNLVPVYPETASQHVFMPPHFLLFPNVGYCGVLAAVLFYLYIAAPQLGAGCIGVLLLLQSGVAIRMNYIWSDDLRLYRYVTDMHPAHPLMLRNLGLALANRGRYDEAASAYQRSIAAKPSPESYNGLGLVLREQGDSTRALAAFQDALTLAPSHTNARVNAAELLRQLGRPEAAEQLLVDGLSVADDVAAVRDRLAVLLRDSGRSAEARAVLEAGLKAAPRDARLWNTLGTVYAELGNVAEARAAWRKAEALAPGMTPAAANLAAMEGRSQ